MLNTNFWERYFKVYDLLNEVRPYQQLMKEISDCASIKTSERVLDAGSGTGNLSLELERRGAIVTALDCSREGLKIHAAKRSAAVLVCADLALPLEFADNTFDKIVSNNTLYTLPKNRRPGVLKEFLRVLKPGGKIVVSNIAHGFQPGKIYYEHLKNEIILSGVLDTLRKVTKLLVPTIKIFYYNGKIKKEQKSGNYTFFRAGEQTEELLEANFVDCTPERRVYAAQALLVCAYKPPK